jgi:hypothetical protein
MNPQFDLVMSLLNVPKYAAPHAWPHLTQRSRAASEFDLQLGIYENTTFVWHVYFSITEINCTINCLVKMIFE